MKRQIKFKINLISLQINFKKVLKTQIALFRTTSLDSNGKRNVKIDKTEPLKFQTPQKIIHLDNSLVLLTTINYFNDIDDYQSKQAQLEIAMEVDGEKQKISKKIDIRDFARQAGQNVMGSLKKDAVCLSYKVIVIFQDENTVKSPKSAVCVAVNKKDSEQKNVKSGGIKTKKDQKQSQQIQISQKSTGKIVRFIENQGCLQQECDQGKDFLQTKSTKNKILAPILNKNYYSSAQNEKKQQIQHKSSSKQHFELTFNNTQKQQQIKQLKTQIKTITKNLQEQVKAHRVTKQALKTEKSMKIQYQKQKSRLQEQIKLIRSTHKQQLYRLQKQSKIHQLNKQQASNIYKREVQQLRQELSRLKMQIMQQQSNKLQLNLQIKSAKDKLNKEKTTTQAEIEELRAQIHQLRSQNKSLKIGSAKQIKQQEGLRQQIQNLQRQIEKKDILLKKLGQKIGEEQVQIQSLKSQITRLKQQIVNHNGSKCGSQTLQWRIQVQKLKKQVQNLKKSEKIMLIQKSKYQVTNKQLQQQLIRNKTAIANILNLVQQTGNDSLITEVYHLTS